MAIYPERKSGKLTGRYRIEVQRDGKRLRGRADDWREARSVERDLLSRLGVSETPEKGRKRVPTPPVAPEAVQPSCLTMGEAVERSKGILWVGQATEDESQRKLKRLVSIVGETLPMDSFDAITVDDIAAELCASGVKPGTINRYLSCISAFLKFCRKRGFRSEPVPELEWRGEDEGRIRWITYAEEAKLMELLPAPFCTVAYVAIRTGMRASELLNLNPDQVQPQWVHLWKTKNGSPRSVPISEDLYRVLVPLVRVMPDYWQLRNEWEKARIAMGLKADRTFVFHACRHTYATRAVQAGVNIRVLQKLMGHKTIQTTLRYAHVDDATLADAALASLSFHDERSGRKKWSDRMGETGEIPPLSALRGAPRTADFRHSSGLGVPPQRSANPYTPVRFRLGPPPPRLILHVPLPEANAPAGRRF